MKRKRAAGVVIKDGKVLLMFRRNERWEYYVFPGGGVDDGETPEQAVVRELLEETSVEVRVKNLFIHFDDDKGSEHFMYLCEYISGEPKLDDSSSEKKKMLSGNQYYEPMWVEINKLSGMTVFPVETKNLIIEKQELVFGSN